MKYFLALITLIISANAYAGLNRPDLRLYGGDNNEVFLGTMGSAMDGESICNPHAEFGDKSSSASIWQPHAQYGDRSGQYSPWNADASSPPVVVDSKGEYHGKFSLGADSIFSAEERVVMQLIIDNEGLEALRNIMCQVDQRQQRS